MTMKTATMNIAKNGEQSSHQYGKRHFPAWHFSMMNDASRNEAIEGCIRDANVADKIVFEIGTGAGLTAMLFAKHGAKKVITCESDDQMYSIAQRVIIKNQFRSKIDLFHCSSTYFLDSVQADFLPDIIFTETLDCGVIGEGFHSIAQDIQRLTTQNLAIFPESISQYGYMIESTDIYSQNSVNFYCDLDLSSVNAYSTVNYFPVRLSLFETKSLSDTHLINTYSYTKDPEHHNLFSLTAYRSGTCHGILSFFHAFYGNHVVSNDIRDRSHWHQAFHPLNRPICVEAGKIYKFSISQSGFVLAYTQEGEGEDKDG